MNFINPQEAKPVHLVPWWWWLQ